MPFAGFSFIPKQIEALKLIASAAKHILLRGGSRSSKTFTNLCAIIARAQLAPGSRHAVLGFRFNRIKQAVILDTFPKVMKLVYPGLGGHMDKQDWFWKFPNGSEIWFAGLDDAERAEKVLGKEFITIFFNEANQISYDTCMLAITRLAQLVTIIAQMSDGTPDPRTGQQMRPKVLYDCNPPKKSHWLYRLFIKHTDPEDGKPLREPENYVEIKMNPKDNEKNIASDYMKTLDAMSASKRRRFRDGEFGDANPNQLFDEDNFERYRIIDVDDLPDMVRIVVAVDPSGSGDTNNEDNDAIGIIVAGLGVDGNAYILADRTVKAGPAVWGKVACDSFEEFEADRIYGEENFGGAMVKFVLRTANPRVPYGKVRASRGKVVRAEPVSALYEQGKVRHVGSMLHLEEELIGFTTNGYEGEKSPNRADALVWAIYALFPHLTKKQEEKTTPDLEIYDPVDSGAGY